MRNLDEPDAEGISVVITCYNLERFIGQTLRSVFEQSHFGPVEVIVVDDCSTDASAEVIQTFPEVKCIRMPFNGGVMLAMLAGVEAAAHDLICLLDGDDLWEPNKLREISRTFASDPSIAFVTHDLRFIDHDGCFMSRESRPAQVLGTLPPADRGEAVREGILAHGDYVWLGSAFSFRRKASAFDAFAHWTRALPDPTNIYQDWPFAYWIATRPNVRLAYIPEPLFRYRIHGANHSGDAATPERARRNFTRTRNTVDAMMRLASASVSLPPRLRDAMSQRATFARAQADLYAGNRFSALRQFVRSVRFLSRTGQFRKESVRFGLGLVLGPALMTKVIARSR